MKTFNSKEERVKSITDTINMNLIMASSMTTATFQILCNLDGKEDLFTPASVEEYLQLVKDNAETIEKFASAAQKLADTKRLIDEEYISINDMEEVKGQMEF